MPRRAKIIAVVDGSTSHEPIDPNGADRYNCGTPSSIAPPLGHDNILSSCCYLQPQSLLPKDGFEASKQSATAHLQQ